MAKKKIEAAALYELKDNMVIMEEENIVKLSEADRVKIEFYVNVLKFKMVFVEPEEKVRKTFKMDKAYKYIEKHDKDSKKEFDKLKEEANAAADKYKSLTAEYKAKVEAEEEIDADTYKKDIAAAKKDMINLQRDAFKAQKELFVKKYGKEAYEEVKAMK